MYTEPSLIDTHLSCPLDRFDSVCYSLHVLYVHMCMYIVSRRQVLDREAQMDNPCKWLNAVAWDNITELDK